MINPRVHAYAMSAKVLATLTDNQQAWAVMTNERLKTTAVKSLGGKWKGLKPHDKFLAPQCISVMVGGPTGDFISKCKKVGATLEWGENFKYFINSIGNWSIRLSKLGMEIQGNLWRKYDRSMNNKDLSHFLHLWDSETLQWKALEEIQQSMDWNAMKLF